jgi:hypothetical protein
MKISRAAGALFPYAPLIAVDAEVTMKYGRDAAAWRAPIATPEDAAKI